MLHPDDMRGNRDLALAALDGSRLQARPVLGQGVAVTERALEPYQIELSISQVLVGFASAVGSLGFFIWALIRLWLFWG